MSVDVWLDLDGELLPIQQYIEVCAAIARQSHCLAEKLKPRVLESDQMNKQQHELIALPAAGPHPPPDQLPLAIESGVDGRSLHAHVERNFNLADTIRKHYREDPIFAKILARPKVCNTLASG